MFLNFGFERIHESESRAREIQLACGPRTAPIAALPAVLRRKAAQKQKQKRFEGGLEKLVGCLDSHYF